MKHTIPLYLPLPLPHSYPMPITQFLSFFFVSVQWKAERKFPQFSEEFFPCAKTVLFEYSIFRVPTRKWKRVEKSGMHKVIVHGVFIRLLLVGCRFYAQCAQQYHRI